MRWLKLIGLAGVIGVVGTASVHAIRTRRAWVDTEPDQLRAHLHERLRAADVADRASSAQPG